jgi:hypothetical protein
MTRPGGVLFTAVCVAGAVTAVTLTVREAVRTPPVVAVVTGTTRVARTTTVTISVRNTTDRARCVDVRVAARDREGRDLGAATAASGLVLAAHGRRAVTARITLTDRQYAERLHAFFPSEHPCRSRESAR